MSAFSGSRIVDASNCILGYRTVSKGAFRNTFSGCTQLSAAPRFFSTKFDANSQDCYSGMFDGCSLLKDLHFPKSLENDETFLAINGSPNFGATNATVHYDL